MIIKSNKHIRIVENQKHDSIIDKALNDLTSLMELDIDENNTSRIKELWNKLDMDDQIEVNHKLKDYKIMSANNRQANTILAAYLRS